VRPILRALRGSTVPVAYVVTPTRVARLALIRRRLWTLNDDDPRAADAFGTKLSFRTSSAWRGSAAEPRRDELLDLFRAGEAINESSCIGRWREAWQVLEDHIAAGP
jgi:hypothetical protein